jgi:hypothetical protein
LKISGSDPISSQLRVQICKPGWEEFSPDSNDVSAEDEEHPLLKSVARKRLVKAD